MTTQDIYNAIIANRPGEPFVYSGDCSSAVGLDWQADTTPPSWDEVTVWVSEAQAAAAAIAKAAAWIQLRAMRDRWLAQTDYVEVYVNSPGSMAHLPAAVQSDITTNSAGWLAWRQALRDLPANVTDPVATVAALSKIHATTDGMPTPLPAAPAAPVVHLT